MVIYRLLLFSSGMFCGFGLGRKKVMTIVYKMSVYLKYISKEHKLRVPLKLLCGMHWHIQVILTWRRRQKNLSKRRYISAKLHDVTSEKTLFFILQVLGKYLGSLNFSKWEKHDVMCWCSKIGVLVTNLVTWYSNKESSIFLLIFYVSYSSSNEGTTLTGLSLFGSQNFFKCCCSMNLERLRIKEATGCSKM